MSSVRETSDVAGGAYRMVAALGRRAGTEDPSALAFMRRLDAVVADGWREAVDGLRQCGYNDSQIGAELGMTRQAVRQRWPRRTPGVVGAGARYRQLD